MSEMFERASVEAWNYQKNWDGSERWLVIGTNNKIFKLCEEFKRDEETEVCPVEGEPEFVSLEEAIANYR